MTATVSTNSNNPKSEKRVSPALHNWRQNIAGDKKLFIILSILHIFAAPAVILAMIIFIYSGSGVSGDADVYLVIGGITTALAGFLGIFPAVDSFSCLHKRSVVDMKLSLPMTAKQRFFSNYLSGLFTYIVPFLGAQAVSLLLMGYGFIFMEGRTFYETYYDADGELVKNPYVCDIFSEAAPILFKLILCGLLAMLMLYTVTVLVTVCCGSKFESIAYTILINALIPLTVVCVTYSIFSNLYGVEPVTAMYKIISYTSVAGAIFVAAEWVTGEEIMAYGRDDWLNYGVWALVYLLIIAAIGALAFFLYRKRRAEQVSKPFVFKLVYYMTVTCAMVCMVSLLIVDSGAGVVPAIIITAIVYMIFEVVANRGFKRFWLSIIKYAATFLAAFGLIVVGSSTDGFGAVSRIPSLSSVTSVEVNGYALSGSYGFFDYMSGWYANVYSMENGDVYFEGRNAPMVFTDKEDIGIILDAHKAIIDFYDRYKTDDFIGGKGRILYDHSSTRADLTIRYNLKGGGSLTRRYDCYDRAAEDILSRLDLTEEYKTRTAERYRKYIAQIPALYEHEMEYLREHPDGKMFYEGRKRVYDVIVSSWLPGRDFNGISIESLCRRGFYEQLADAYAKDIMAITEENYYYSDLHNVWHVVLTGDMRYGAAYITVPESFSNTVELLEYFDFDLNRIEDASDEEVLKALINSASTGHLGIFTTEEYRGIRSYNGNAFVLSKDEPNEFYVYDFGEDMITLARSVLPMHIADENGYIISIGTSYTVPEELWDTARRIPRSERNGEIEALYMETVQGESNDYYY